jgi:hypothetical protein
VLKTYESETEEVTGSRRKVYSKKVHSLYCSPFFIEVVSSRMRWSGHEGVLRIREMRNAYTFLVTTLKIRARLEDLSVNLFSLCNGPETGHPH